MKKAAKSFILVLCIVMSFTICAYAQVVNDSVKNGNDKITYGVEVEWSGWFTTYVEGGNVMVNESLNYRYMEMTYTVRKNGKKTFEDCAYSSNVRMMKVYGEKKGNQVTSVFRLIKPSTELATITKIVHMYED